MSEQPPRRAKVRAAPETPTGYRATRRGSKALKTAKRAERQHKVMTQVDGFGRTVRNVLYAIAWTIAAIVLTVIVVLLAATAINTVARWNAQRLAQHATSPKEQARRAKDNLLVIGVDGAKATGFLAVRVDRKGDQVFGIAIPDGAFIDVPGQGFDRIGDAYPSGVDPILTAISNYLTVPFRNYLIVPTAAYKEALTSQSVAGLVSAASASNIESDTLVDLNNDLGRIPQKNVALVPMPVKPIKLGDQTYFEPQRAEIADLLKSWWGVDATDEQNVTRVIVYNGSGTPGIAGIAAQQLIRAGYRVVDTKNADNFKYANTRIVVKRGDVKRGEPLKDVLGVGTVTAEPTSADVTDVIVIIGKDYRPPKAEGGTE